MWRLSYRLYRALSGVQYRIERRFSRAGLLVLGGIVLTGAVGVDTTLTLAYQLFSLLAALVLVAMAGARWVKLPVVVEPRLPRLLTAGEAFVLRFAVRNATDRPVGGLALRARLADHRPTLAAFRAGAHLPTYRAWVRLTWTNAVARVEEAPVPALAGRAEVLVEVRGQALRRGRLRIEAIDAARSDALGLCRRLVRVAPAAELTVLPPRYVVPPLALGGTRRYQPGGLPQGTSVGDAEEFVGLRDYRPGDPLQRIHWRSLARTGRPVVKEFQDEFAVRHALLLDTSGPPEAAGALDEAVAIAASFAWTLDTQECLLDLIFIGGEVHVHTAGRGHLQAEQLLRILAAVALNERGDVSAMTAAVRARRHSLSACVCILLAWDEARRALVQALRAAGIEPLILVVAERAPPGLPAVAHWLVPGRIAEGLARL